MAAYIVKRIIASVLTLLLIMCITFLLMNAIPGSPFLTEKSTPEMIARANAKYGLDQPLLVQLFNYIKNYLKGDLGTSLKMQEGTSVATIIFGQGKFILSLKLGLYALALAILPTCIFLLSGVLLRHWLLVCSAVLFGIGHIFVTQRNVGRAI